MYHNSNNHNSIVMTVTILVLNVANKTMDSHIIHVIHNYIYIHTHILTQYYTCRPIICIHTSDHDYDQFTHMTGLEKK